MHLSYDTAAAFVADHRRSREAAARVHRLRRLLRRAPAPRPTDDQPTVVAGAGTVTPAPLAPADGTPAGASGQRPAA